MVKVLLALAEKMNVSPQVDYIAESYQYALQLQSYIKEDLPLTDQENERIKSIIISIKKKE